MRLTKKIPNANVTTEVIGRTVEYNDIVLLKITEKLTNKNTSVSLRLRAGETKYDQDVDEKKIIFIVHGLNVMGAQDLQCLYDEKDFLALLTMYTKNLHLFDIYLIPMANPDGFAHSRVRILAYN